MSRFISPRFGRLCEYVPGEQPQDMQYIKLNTNESPYPPSDGVLAAVNKAEVSKLNLYPDPDCSVLYRKAADMYGVLPENIVAGNGSDEILSFCFAAFCDKDTGAAFPDISYGFYEVFSEYYNLDYKKIPLNSDFSISPSDYFGVNRTIFIANPNAPTGIALSLDDIENILKANPDNVVVIDEAYVDFGAQSSISLIDKYDNLVVVQTFSKSRALAGARLGFAITNKELAKDLNKLRFSSNPYNINRLTMQAGIAAIEDNDYYMSNCQKIIATRKRISNELAALGFFVTESYSNFIFAKSDKISGADYYKALRKNGVLVRHFGGERIKDHVRITVGTDEQMDTLIENTKLLLKEW